MDEMLLFGGNHMEFRILGPVEVRAGGVPVGPPTRPQQNVVLAALLIDGDRPVPVDRLIERVWGDDPPAQARRTLHTHVARIRRQLGTLPLTRRDGGYHLQADPEHIDLHRFHRLVERATTAPPRERAELLRQALGLWRGDALAGLAGEWAARTRERLGLLLIDATVAWADAEVAIGRAGVTIDPLTRLIGEHPLIEAPVAALMRALAAVGRTAEALEHFDAARGRLADELGADPGSELSTLHRELLRGTAADVPAQLPAAVPGFTGRAAEIELLDEILARSEREPIGVTIAVLSGMPGVGKTALAAYWAHRVRDRFPDGQLYTNLRGFDPAAGATEPADAVQVFLEALRVPANAIPTRLEARTALYRGLLSGRRMLILLDNAASAEQVRPLLPGGAGCLVVVTSRHRVPGLVAAEGAQPVPVGLFAVAEALDLLTARLGRRRVAAELPAARDIVEECGRLPLALALTAAHAALQPSATLGDLARELRAGRGGLAGFATDDPIADLRSVFSWSYRALGPGAATLFRLAGLHPGTDIGVAAAASLTATPSATAHRRLAELTRAHLLIEPRPGRYALHDLLRAYARELTDAGEREPALTRLLDHHLHSAYNADRLLRPNRDPIVPEPPAAGVRPAEPTDHAAALAWFDAERTALPALVTLAADSGRDRQAWQLAWSMADFVHRRGYWHDWVTVQRAAVTATGRLGDRAAQGHAQRLLGVAQLRLGRLDDAREQLDLARDRFAELGDPAGQAMAHRGLGRVAARRDDHAEALRQARLALELFTRAGASSGRASAENAVGWMLAELGRPDDALPHCTRALGLQERLGDVFGQANTLDSLGYIHLRRGELDRAAECYERSLALSRRLGDQHGEADTLSRLGDVHEAAGDLAAARRAWQRSLELAESVNPGEVPRLHAKLRPPAGATS
jgi:DNA-binding SARP family transcriptional activator/tetratricopeptide (TPR) repeat protein